MWISSIAYQDNTNRPFYLRSNNGENHRQYSDCAPDLCRKDPIHAPSDLPIPEAIQMMISEGRKIMVIVDEEKHPLGLVDRQSLLEALINVPHDLE